MLIKFKVHSKCEYNKYLMKYLGLPWTFCGKGNALIFAENKMMSIEMDSTVFGCCHCFGKAIFGLFIRY